VKLHWANADQYYIKTAEHFQNYAFKLPSERRVRFEIVSASTEQNNNKPVNGRERRFILCEADPAVVEGTDLVLRFEYRADEQKRKQDALNQVAYDTVMGLPDLQDWQKEFAIKDPTEKNPDRTLLQKYLADFTARNTFDYFIHKSLGKFLRRELDFYIKSEVINLADIQHESPIRVKHLVSKVRVLNDIGDKIIQFLEQIEEFQKKLWLKKKFVLETHYCITLDRVPEDLYPEIIANQAQIEEWKRLFAIDDIEEKVGDLFGGGTPGYSELLTIEFLKANDKLLVDTQFFDETFKTRLLGSIENFDEQCNGLLIHSENFQALNLLQERYQEEVKCIYIDPPYNTSSSSIPYKNNYQHSSWGTMMLNRLALLQPVLTEDGAIFVSIDKTERTFLEYMLNTVFGEDNQIEELIWTQNTANSQLPTYSTNHEYVEVYARNRNLVERDYSMFREPKPGYAEVMDLVASLNPDFPSIDEIEKQIKDLYKKHIAEFRADIESSGRTWDAKAKKEDPWKGLYNYCHAEYRDSCGRYVEPQLAKDKKASIWIWREISPSAPASKQSSTTKDPGHPNFRYYQPLHPITQKECPHPKGGWKFPYLSDPENPNRNSFESLVADHRIAWGTDENKVPQTKGFLHEVETNISTSVFYEYNDGEAEMANLFGDSGLFLSPKSSRFVKRFLAQANSQNSAFIDCFRGSGSSGHAAVQINREDKGNRKYVLVEVAHYFETVLKPRMLKAVYSKDWKNGKPISRQGSSHCIKYLRLESYEDALNNIKDPQRTQQQELALKQDAGFREEYMLTYKLDTEARGSASLLNPEAFIHPFNYQLKTTQNDDTRYVTVDLIETFNYLLGLTVQRLNLVEAIKTVHGVNRWGDRILVIWRDLDEVDNDALDDWFKAQDYDQEDPGFDLVYVNGDNNLENLRPDTETWQVLLTDAEFHRLMFDMSEVSP
jgi:adenine-specific DNA-methyltransferase